MYELSDIDMQSVKKIEKTTQCSESIRFNTKCKYNDISKIIYTFDDDKRIKTIDYKSRQDHFEYPDKSIYPSKITEYKNTKHEKQKIIKRDSNNFPVSQDLRWSNIGDITVSSLSPREITNIDQSTTPAPGEITAYHKGVVQSIRYYAESKTENYTCSRHKNEFGITFIDKTNDINPSEIIARTVFNEKGDKISVAIKSPGFIYRKSYTYMNFNEKGNWLIREACTHDSSWNQAEFCEKETRFIEYK